MPQRLQKRHARELRTLIGVENGRGTEARYRLIRDIHTENCSQDVRQPPCQHPAVVLVHDRDRVEQPRPIGM